MKFNKATMMTMGATALFTLVIIAIINNTKALKAVSETVNGDKGWF
ncbi:hypothetical protein [Vibrio vulnificus]|uniref:Uncharacterized protein n=1 Tax=Vibrio vulnificus TaxID=672 RepID=A0AAW4HHP5_VIBVL|nr:hypothetical protein [Vibrio vulnificus]MBN8124544.1 hypothetical protein [Vibrio vulnificus]MBN8124578.1 hypothetical protein [Vibrio vulnificus]